MTRSDFENVLKMGENVCVEFKRGGNGAQGDTFETVCAFLNRFGGDTRLYSGADPVMDEEDVFSITIPLNDGFSPEVGDKVAEKGLNGTQGSGLKSGLKSSLKSGLNATDIETMSAIAEKPSITIPELQTRLSLSRNGVKKSLNRLKAGGRLRRVGPDKGGHWEIVEKA